MHGCVTPVHNVSRRISLLPSETKAFKIPDNGGGCHQWQPLIAWVEKELCTLWGHRDQKSPWSRSLPACSTSLVTKLTLSSLANQTPWEVFGVGRCPLLKSLGIASAGSVQWGSCRAEGLHPPLRSSARHGTQSHPATPIHAQICCVWVWFPACLARSGAAETAMRYSDTEPRLISARSRGTFKSQVLPMPSAPLTLLELGFSACQDP